MRKHLAVILGAAASSSAAANSTDAQLSRPSPDEAKSIVTLMCETQSCDGATSSTPGCHSYATPLRTCYNARDLFPGDESWSEFDIYDDMIMLNIKRTFYTSADGSCTGRGEDEGVSILCGLGDLTSLLLTGMVSVTTPRISSAHCCAVIRLRG